MGRPYFDANIREYGGSIGYEGMKQKANLNFKVKRAVKNSMQVVGSSSTSSYSGRILKPSSLSQGYIRKISQRSGACSIEETHGVVSDPDVVAIGHTAWNYKTVFNSIGYAIIRKLLAKAGVYPDSAVTNAQLGNRDGTTPGGWSLVMDYYDTDGTENRIDYEVPQNPTIDTLALSSGLIGRIDSQMFSENPSMLTNIFLYSQFYNDNGKRLMASLNMKQCNLKLMIHSTTSFQNRTLGATTASGLQDAVDAQPLKGPAFAFYGLPKSKGTSHQKIENARKEGVILWRKADSVYNEQWGEVPVRNEFSNVSASQYCRLGPGQIKSFSISKEYNGSFEKVINELKFTREGSGTGVRYSTCPGPCQVVFFEEEMNTGSANNINLGYESQHTSGAVLSQMKAQNLHPQFTSVAVSNP